MNRILSFYEKWKATEAGDKEEATVEEWEASAL